MAQDSVLEEKLRTLDSEPKIDLITFSKISVTTDPCHPRISFPFDHLTPYKRAIIPFAYQPIEEAIAEYARVIGKTPDELIINAPRNVASDLKPETQFGCFVTALLYVDPVTNCRVQQSLS